MLKENITLDQAVIIATIGLSESNLMHLNLIARTHIRRNNKRFKRKFKNKITEQEQNIKELKIKYGRSKEICM